MTTEHPCLGCELTHPTLGDFRTCRDVDEGVGLGASRAIGVEFGRKCRAAGTGSAEAKAMRAELVKVTIDTLIAPERWPTLAKPIRDALSVKHPDRVNSLGAIEVLEDRPGACALCRFRPPHGMAVVINLARRKGDRYPAFKERCPLAGVKRFEAVDGTLSPPPAWFAQGAGAWGCLQSHIRVLEAALAAKARWLLVFEDDATFEPGFVEDFKDLLVEADRLGMSNPEGGQLYLGGQHMRENKNPPTEVGDGVVSCFNVNRTHAYVLSGGMIRTMYQHLTDAPAHAQNPRHHVDHRMGVLHMTGKHLVLAAHPWLCGQAAGKSDICHQKKPIHVWNIADRKVRRSKGMVLTSRRVNDNLAAYVRIIEMLRTSGFRVSRVDGYPAWGTMHRLLDEVERCDFAVIWNGDEPGGRDWLGKVCDSYAKPWCVAEMGLLPQKGHYHLDPSGITGHSSLMGELDWVNEEDRTRAADHIRSHLAVRGWKYRGAGGYVLVPLQLEHDTAMYMHVENALKRMDGLIARVRELRPGVPIMVRPHPVAVKRNPQFAATLKLPEGVTVRTDASTMDLAIDAAEVIGATSTVLYETAALGAPTTALGRCPMAVHTTPEARADLLAAIVARQFPANTKDLTPWLERMGMVR